MSDEGFGTSDEFLPYEEMRGGSGRRCFCQPNPTPSLSQPIGTRQYKISLRRLIQTIHPTICPGLLMERLFYCHLFDL